MGGAEVCSKAVGLRRVCQKAKDLSQDLWYLLQESPGTLGGWTVWAHLMKSLLQAHGDLTSDPPVSTSHFAIGALELKMCVTIPCHY